MTLAWEAPRLCQASSRGPSCCPVPAVAAQPLSTLPRVLLPLPHGGSQERGSRTPQLLPTSVPAGVRVSPQLLVSSWEWGAGFSPVPPADLRVPACLLRLPEALLSRGLASWPVKQLAAETCVPLVCETARRRDPCPARRELWCPERGARPAVDARPASAGSSPREIPGRCLCFSFRLPTFCPAPYLQGEFFRVSRSPRPLRHLPRGVSQAWPSLFAAISLSSWSFS